MFPNKFTLILSALSVLAPGIAAQDSEKTCTIHDNGLYYDLNPLSASKDYELKTPGGHKFLLNACQAVRTETFGLKDGLSAADIAGFVRLDHGDFSIGKVNKTLSINDGRIQMILSEGSKCKFGDVRSSSVVEYVCDKSAFGPGQPRLVAQLPPGDDDPGCFYVIEWRTQFACPTRESRGFWGLFAFWAGIFLIILMLYTVLGTLYNRYVLQLRGFDQIPQFTIESMRYHGREAFDWLQDICSGLRPSPNGGENINPVSHQAQFGVSVDEEMGGSFSRPQQQQRTNGGSDINPISHQFQVNSESRSFQAVPTLITSETPTSQKSFPTEGDLISNTVKNEGAFTLGGDDEDGVDASSGNGTQTISSSTQTTSTEQASTSANDNP